MKQYVFDFSQGSKQMKDLLGGKGANLAEMSNIGLPVPAGFTISTEACNQYFLDQKTISAEVKSQVDAALEELQKQVGKNFGGSPCLLVSVRSGSVISMPGMMDTILNLGLNDQNLEGFAASTGSMRFALDCYRRFIQMYGSVVLQIPMFNFDEIIESVKHENNVVTDQDLSEEHLRSIISQYKAVVVQQTGSEFEQDPVKQLYAAIEAVFSSWNNDRAITYRRINAIPDEIGTAVNVQMMVFGNTGDDSGTGVVFTRNPSTGEKNIFGEFLMNAQGEDVVAGIRTPKDISELETVNKEVYNELLRSADLLERHYNDMQDIEFTIEQGKFYLLQTRNGKRSAAATVKVAVDFVNEGLLEKEEAIERLDLSLIDQLLHAEFDKEVLKKTPEIALGLPASPGAATGKIYFDAESVEEAAQKGEDVILVRVETSPEDIKGMISANGILTARGGMTSHAAVVARGMGKCCVSGCQDIDINESEKQIKVGEHVLKEGDYISIDGTTGKVYVGKVPTSNVDLSEDFTTLMNWADTFSSMEVFANADTVTDAENALKFGAKGIGLCRTEHMFFEDDRITEIRRMIVSQTKEEREAALENVYPYQKEDFKKIFTAMGSRSVNIRLLDPPLHEFLPREQKEIAKMATVLNLEESVVKKAIEDLEEINPMMGLRGCRLGILHPEVYEVQAKAIINAALEVLEQTGVVPNPEIMIPLVGSAQELAVLRARVVAVKQQVDPENKLAGLKIGTMIEIPRACLVADKVAEHADYFSFGTNDLTQMTYGFSRDDSGKLISQYVQDGILKVDPFSSIDQEGVGTLIKMAIEKGRSQKPDLKIGICGEQGGDQNSIEFFNTLDLDYVSCSPFRVPKARLAAAKAAVRAFKSTAVTL